MQGAVTIITTQSNKCVLFNIFPGLMSATINNKLWWPSLRCYFLWEVYSKWTFLTIGVRTAQRRPPASWRHVKVFPQCARAATKDTRRCARAPDTRRFRVLYLLVFFLFEWRKTWRTEDFTFFLSGCVCSLTVSSSFLCLLVLCAP